MLVNLKSYWYSKPFTFLTIVFVIITANICIWIGSNNLFISLVNFSHFRFLNIVFTCISFLGNGYFAVGLSFLYILNNRTTIVGIQLLLAFIVSGLLAQFLKKIFNLPRPREFFNNTIYESILTNAHGGYTSFPSGHTTTAFACAFILCHIYKGKLVQVGLFIIAVLVAYSRVYLGHHFVEDVLAGAVLGTLSSWLIVKLFVPNTKFKMYSKGKKYKTIL